MERNRAEKQLSVAILPNAVVIFPAGAPSKFVFGKVGFSPSPTDVIVPRASKSQVLYN